MPSSITEEGVRLVVTGHTPDGLGTVVRDDHIGVYPQRAAGYLFYNLWGADTLPSFPDDGVPAECPDLGPGMGGLRFVKLVVQPDSEYDFSDRPDGAPEAVDGIHTSSSGSQVHFTSTLDLIVVIEGPVWLELDNGNEVLLRKGDFAIQNGTRHAWRNHGTKAAEVAVAVVGINHAGFGPA